MCKISVKRGDATVVMVIANQEVRPLIVLHRGFVFANIFPVGVALLVHVVHYAKKGEYDEVACREVAAIREDLCTAIQK